jgi:hypothetical protein
MEFSIHEASDGPPMYSIGGLEYYESNEKGFFLHGYLSYGGTIAPKRSPLNQRFMFKGNAAPSISEFVWRITRPYEVSPLDTIRREYPPLMVLQFPLDVGTAWTFRGPGSYIHIDKKVIGRVDVAAAGNTYNCFEVQWLYDMDNDGVTDTDLTVIDCIASEGLIQRTIQFSNIVIATSESPEGIGLIDSRQVYLLTSNSSSSSARGTFF